MSYKETNTEDSYKIVMLGSGAVGKSALTIRLVSGEFRGEYDPTIEDSYQTNILIDNKEYELDILDTAGQEQFSALQDHWIRESEIFILVYSITSKASFNYIDMLIKKIKRNKDNKKVPMMICGNKSDLNNIRQVSTLEGKDFSQSIDCPFIETSAKTGINVQTLFSDTIKLYINMQNHDRNNKRCSVISFTVDNIHIQFVYEV